MGQDDGRTPLRLIVSRHRRQRKECTLDIYLKDGNKYESPIDPMLLAHVRAAWLKGHIIAAIQVAAGERTFLINLLSVDLERTLQESGQMVITRTF